MWVECDCNLPSGESFVRQFLYGTRFFEGEFGKKSTFLWLPDVFGYSAALPQILKQCEIDTFITTKLGMHFVHYGPAGHQLTEKHQTILERNCQLSGGSWLVTDDRSAVRDADFIYTDVWYGLYDEEVSGENYMDVFYPKYQVTWDLMNAAGPDSKFMHCLPANRGEEVVDEVDGRPGALPVLGRGREPQALHPRHPRHSVPPERVEPGEGDQLPRHHRRVHGEARQAGSVNHLRSGKAQLPRSLFPIKELPYER